MFTIKKKQQQHTFWATGSPTAAPSSRDLHNFVRDYRNLLPI